MTMMMMFQECASVEVEEHTGCVCGCDPGVRAACEAGGHTVFREETCQCQCRDIQVRRVFQISVRRLVVIVVCSS